MFEVRNDYGSASDAAEYISAEYARLNAEAEAKRARLLAVFGTEAGAEVLDIIKKDICLVETSCFDESALSMARKAGRQEVYFSLVAALKEAKEEAEENGH